MNANCTRENTPDANMEANRVGDEFPINPELLEWEKTADIKTLPELIRRTVDEYGNCPYLGVRVGNEYKFKTYNEIYQEIVFFASALLGVGCQVGDRVANFSVVFMCPCMPL